MFYGDRIKELRNEKSLSQAELAQILYISQSSVSEYESGNQQPPASTLIQLADFFDVNIDYLLGRTDIRISIEKLKQKLTTKSGSFSTIEFMRLDEDVKEAFIVLFNSLNRDDLSNVTKRK